jgi:hypothetical protein
MDCRIVIKHRIGDKGDSIQRGARAMNISVLHITTAILVVGATVALFMMRQKHMAAASERRMISMMERIGLDPAIASGGEPGSVLECVIEASMKEIRKRCQACSTVDECKRWLAGKEAGDNTFCPNAEVFKALKIICDDIANNHHTGAT